VTPVEPRRQVGRLVVIDPVGNYGGSTRFIRRLLPELKRIRPELRVSFFGDGESIARDEIGDELASAGINVQELRSLHPAPWKSRSLWFRIAFKIRRRLRPAGLRWPLDLEAALKREIDEATEGADLAYFPWPQGVPPPNGRTPLATTIHDLNFKWFFGSLVLEIDGSKRLDSQIGNWLRVASVIASSNYMAGEIARFYPAAPSARVVRLASFATGVDDVAHVNQVLAKFRLAPPYVLCPTQMPVHKNIGPLIAAHALLRDRFPDLRLVLTGLYTEAATGRATSIGSARDGGEPDVIGLGYVSNTEIDALIEGASVVVNPSLYEAGNGSGLDAWSRGTPVAMSEIPPFLEHVSTLGVEAAMFDPRDPKDIASKVADILDRPKAWAEAAARSKAAIASRTWADVAEEYLEVFDAAAAQNQDG
jgi:glycosyltransferase involved in cell wall biosynthesis